MPITIQNSAGGGVTLDSTTSSNETLQLPSGGGTLAPLASPSFTGNVGIGTSSPISPLDVTLEGTGQRRFLVNYDDSAITIKGSNASSSPESLRVVADTFKVNTGTTSSGSEAMRIDSSGQLMVGGTAPVQPSKVGIQGGSSVNRLLTFEVTHTTDFGPVGFHNGNGVIGSISMYANSVSFNTSSDYRLKTNVTPMVGATAAVKLLKPCNFDWIADGSNVNGFLAHELAEVVPEAATGTKDAMMDEEYEVTPATDTEEAVMGTRSVPDMQGIDQSKLVPLLTATIQELIARIEALENV